MIKITVIIGLPGSGKSFLGRALSLQSGTHFYDDCATVLSAYNELKEGIANWEDCIVADPKFCEKSILLSFEQNIKTIASDVFFEYIYFANSPEQCVLNSQRRADGRLVSESYINYLSRQYAPDISNAVSCYDKNSH